ncbi:MAG: aminotransferase class I/II-fold pyridoxal phosphate-dependent enzyme, partial [Clostridium sp.]|nr:aminotransferase class I/II-fold pyridoxal phosphate-dependent enzyme [Clostridium sp.]
TGWRIGYTGSSPEIAKLMSSVQSHQTSNANSIAQKAALEAMTGPQDAMKEMTVEFDKRRKYMYDRVCKLPYVNAIEPKGAFYVFIDVSEALEKSYKGEKVATSTNFAKILIEEFNVAVIPCSDFGAPEYIRLSYAISIEQIEKGLNRIEDCLKQLQ